MSNNDPSRNKEKQGQPTNENDTTSWDWLTVMNGPKVSGQDKIWFGRIEDTWEQLDDDLKTVLCAEPVEHIPLPHPMTRPEIEEFLSDGWGERIIENAGKH